MKKVLIHCDGSSMYNGKPYQYGAGAAVLEYNNKYQFRAEFLDGATNQRAEILAACIALEGLPEPCDVDIYTDSIYVVNCITGKWKRKVNLDLWERLDAATLNHKVNWNWVKGHNGNEMNELADELAYKVLINKHVEFEYKEKFVLV